MRILTLALIVFGVSAPVLGANLKGNVEAGKKTAAALCAGCHDTTGVAKPRNPPGNAPPFISLAQSADQTPQKMRRYLTFPHGRMDNVIVTGREADDVVSYIASLRSPQLFAVRCSSVLFRMADH